MIIGEAAWHQDFWGLHNTVLTKTVSLNVPDRNVFVKVALVRFEDHMGAFQKNPWVSIGIIRISAVNKFPVSFPLTKGLRGTTAANEHDANVYTFFVPNMLEAVVGGQAENAIGSFTWVIEFWN
jgi:hypothetical protein